jgi:hypothetical protein
MKISLTSVYAQVYVLPTIKWTYDKYLYGHMNIELWWWKWGIEIAYGIQE